LKTAVADRLSDYLRSRFPDTTVSEVRFLVSGFESEIHTFHLQRAGSMPEHYVLRLFTGEGAAEKLKREAQGLSLLRNAGYPVPALLLQEWDPAILGRPFEIIEKLEGQALWPVLASANPEQQHQLLSRFGSLLAQLHRLDWHCFTEHHKLYRNKPEVLLEEILSQYRSLYGKYNLTGFLQVLDWLEAQKHKISIQPAVVHQDFHANNVFLCSDGQFAVIDWTQLAVSDYRIDLCWSVLIMGDFGNADWGKEIREAYVSHSSHPIEDIDYFQAIVSMKLLASTVISLTFGPGELGLRPETAQIPEGQVVIYQGLAQRLREITSITVPELEDLLRNVSGGTDQG
jgi:aminoglycoside phosphotransferase (APT) family kinase protein